MEGRKRKVRHPSFFCCRNRTNSSNLNGNDAEKRGGGRGGGGPVGPRTELTGGKIKSVE